MRSSSAFVFVLVLLASACGGGSAASQQPGQASGVPALPSSAASQPTPAMQPTPATQPTPASQATPAGAPVQPGSGVATVTLTGGADAGTFAAAPDIEPNCTVGLIGPEGWGVQLTNLVAGDHDLGSLQLVSAAPGKADDEDAFFQGTEFLMTVTIGPSLVASSRNYEVAVRTEAADEDSSGTGSAQVTDSGTTAVIHATGTTDDGVGIDATVNCPSVLRQ